MEKSLPDSKNAANPITPKQVTDYLRQNPEFLAAFVKDWEGTGQSI